MSSARGREEIDMICVLAGNYRQFMQWCSESGLHPQREAYYCESHELVAGLEFEEFTKVGTWWEATDDAQYAWVQARLTHKVRDGIRIA